MVGFKVETRRPDGTPCCPICGSDVAEAGQFCGPTCMTHFLSVVSNQSGVVEMENYIDSADQPWSAFTEQE